MSNAPQDKQAALDLCVINGLETYVSELKSGKMRTNKYFRVDLPRSRVFKVSLQFEITKEDI